MRDKETLLNKVSTAVIFGNSFDILTLYTVCERIYVDFSMSQKVKSFTKLLTGHWMNVRRRSWRCILRNTEIEQKQSYLMVDLLAVMLC